MKIRMYNCYFGDCFCIEDAKKNVYVDFGIHKQALNVRFGSLIAGKIKDMRHEEIMKDILTEDILPDFLLTHYHLDHYSGLLYMINRSKKTPSFKTPVVDKFYLPDIWNVADMTPLSILLLEDILKNAKLTKDKRGYTLYELVTFFTTSVRNVVFVKAGTELDFPTKCLALWPDLSKIKKDLPDILNYISSVDKDFLDDLEKLAIQFQSLMRYYKDITLDDRSGVLWNIEEFIVKHITSLEILNNKDNEKIIQSYLNSYGNDISIVFHNKQNGKENYLFTGDISNQYMKLIASSSTHKLHDKYYCIKIPHHGTTNHYYDFKPYDPKIIMIPNGSCIKDSYKISQKYVNDFKSNTKMFCANCDWCQARPQPRINKCVCKHRYIVYSRKMEYVV